MHVALHHCCLGHVLDHAGTIFGDHRVYEMLRATPAYLNSIEELKLSFDYKKPWPFETDPTVPAPLRQWYQTYCTQQSARLMENKAVENKDMDDVKASPQKTDEPGPEIIASLDPRKEDWITAPPIVDHHLDYEGPPTKPDARLTDWDYDPAVHNEQVQTQLWKEGKQVILQKKRASGPSFLRKLKPPD